MGYTKHEEKSWPTLIGGCVVALIVAFVLNLLFAWIAELLWNALVPALLHGPHIGYWTALLLVCALGFVGGFFKSTTDKSS